MPWPSPESEPQLQLLKQYLVKKNNQKATTSQKIKELRKVKKAVRTTLEDHLGTFNEKTCLASSACDRNQTQNVDSLHQNT